MLDVGIMIEGQEDLTWSRFLKLAATVEALGFTSLFRSDHLTTLQGSARRDVLSLWPSLTALAIKTSRIRFGPMVSPMTFRHPALVARAAVDVCNLSGGRLDLGLGAGWNAAEHQMFGLVYPEYASRLDMLDEGAELIRSLWSSEPSSFKGKQYQLEKAQSFPLPEYPIPMIMGGKGDRTLQIVARHADEWNCSYAGVERFAEKSAQLDHLCAQAGRDPSTLVRSIMLPFVIAEDELGVQERIEAHRRMFPSLPEDLAGWLAAGFIAGTPEDVKKQVAAFAEAGVTRFMLQHNDLDDHTSLKLLAAEVLPGLGSLEASEE